MNYKLNNKISTMTIIPPESRWVFVDSEKLIIDPNEISNIKNKLFIFNIRYLSFFYISTIALLRIIFFYFRQFFVVTCNSNNKITSIILESGRGYDSQNINRFIKIKNNEKISIQAFRRISYMRYHRVGFFVMMKNAFDSIFCFYYSIFRLDQPNSMVLLALDRGVSNISMYVYLKSFFLEFNKKYPECTVYTDGALIASHASISSGMKTIRTYHGLMGKTNPNTYPEYNSIYTYSLDEKKYLSNLGIGSKIYIYQSSPIKAPEKIIIFFMSEDASTVKAIDLIEIVKLFRSFNYKIYAKLHPLNDAPQEIVNEYNLVFDNYEDMLNSQKIERISGDSASDVISIKKPSFIVSWDSTAACEALRAGVIPINIPMSSVDISGFVYSVRKRSISWHSEKDMVKGFLNGGYLHNNILKILRERV